MKLFKILPLAAMACIAVSCQTGTGSGLSETSSQTDSLMYYLGQMNAADYLREANRDTVLKEQSEKQAYLNGVRAGMAALKEGNENYNKGVMMGMQMASQMMSFSEQMDVTVNRDAYVNSLSGAIMADTMPNTGNAQMEFRKVMGNIEAAKEARDKVSSQESLKQVAEKAGLPKISDDLYGKVTNTTDGAAFTEDEDVSVEATFEKENGEVINVPVSPRGKIGNKRSFPEIISNAIMTMKSGETGEFLTSAHALLGARAKQMKMEPTDVVKVTLTATAIPQEDNKDAKK